MFFATKNSKPSDSTFLHDQKFVQLILFDFFLFPIKALHYGTKFISKHSLPPRTANKNWRELWSSFFLVEFWSSTTYHKDKSRQHIKKKHNNWYNKAIIKIEVEQEVWLYSLTTLDMDKVIKKSFLDVIQITKRNTSLIW